MNEESNVEIDFELCDEVLQDVVSKMHPEQLHDFLEISDEDHLRVTNRLRVMVKQRILEEQWNHK